MTADSSSELINKFFSDKNIAKTYSSIERATGPPAKALIIQAGILPDSTVDRFEVLDNACGTGVVTATLAEAFQGHETRLKVVCGDVSEGMVESIKERIAQMHGLDAKARMLDGQAMDLPSNQFTHVLTNFGFQSFPEPMLGIQETIRVVKPGGIVGMTNWITPGWEPAFRLAVSRIPGAPSSLPDPLPFMTRSGRWSDATWTREQLKSIPEIDPESVVVQHHSFTLDLENEEGVKAFIGRFGGMLSVFTAEWSEEERNACGDGRLVEAMVRAMKEEPILVWKSLVTTARKRS